MTRIDAPWVTGPASRAVMGALHDAYFVGGCVRDALLGLPVADIDVATPLPPRTVIDRLEAAGLRAVPTGLSHGTITAVVDRQPIEVTTFRADIATFGRHAEVAFTTDMGTDAGRRDFTINALYAAADGTVIDPLGGLPDLRARRVRFIGRAEDRIREDFLRILRFFRFFAWYGGERHRSRRARRLCRARRRPRAAGARAHRLGSPQAARRARPGARRRGDGRSRRARPLPARRGRRVRWRRSLTPRRRPAPPPTGRRDSRRSGPRTPAAACACRAPRRPRRPASPRPWRMRWRMTGRPPRWPIATVPKAARAALLIRAAATATAPPPFEAELARGAGARLPLAAAELIAAGMAPGPALGQALARAEAAWIDSDFTLDKHALLAQVLENRSA